MKDGYETLLNMSCTRSRRTYTQNLRDSVNNRLPDPDPAEETYPCHLEQETAAGVRSSNREVIVGRDLQLSEYRLFLPAEADVEGTDQILIDGIAGTFEVVGPPAKVRNPRSGVVHHIEATLKLVDE